MSELNFTEEDKQKFIEFLNMIAKTAEFKVNTGELIQYFKLLSYMQQKILLKIDASILEVKRVIKSSSEEATSKESN